jgi:geranylgeranyl reductase family protein
MGYGVVVVEQKERLEEPVCCTGIISRECVNTFSIEESTIFRWVNSARLFSPSGKLLRLWRPEPQAAVIDRVALNVALARRAQEQGAEYVLGSRVHSVQVRDDLIGIEAVRQRERSRFEARVAVIATGFSPRFTNDLGFGAVRDFVMGAQAEVEADGVDEVEVYCGQEIAPAFFGWLVPTSPQKALVGLMSRRTPVPYLEKLLSSLVAEGRIRSEQVNVRIGGVPLRPLPRTYGQRMLVVGTAAGQVKPTTAGGIYFGLLSADIAADNLRRALEADDLSARSLAGYEHDWRRKLGREMRLGYRARRFYERLSDRQLDRIFDIIKSSGIDEALLRSDGLTFDWHGRVLTRLPGLIWGTAFSRAMARMKIPFR